MKRSALLFFAVALSACGASHTPDRDSGTPPGDASPPADTGRVDAGRLDAGCSLPEPANHRAVARGCDDERPYPPITDPLPDWSSCTAHSDCTEGTNGRCTGNNHDGWACTYDRCFADAECGSGPCECEGGFRSDSNVCLAGNCRVDADCGPGGWCSPTLGDCGDYTGWVGYYCRTCEDECLDDSDCTEEPGTFGGGYCSFSEMVGHWVCRYSHCVG